MRTTPLVVAGLAVVVLFGARAASAFISGNTIDGLATYKEHGRLVRVTGPIACTRGERIANRVAIRQPATAARARGRWNGRCTGEVQHWRVRARARGATRFENGRGRVCAVARTRRGARVTDRRRWCERVQVAATFGRGETTVAQDVCFTDSELRRINVPTALVWGKHDRFVPLALAERASARLGTPSARRTPASDDRARHRPPLCQS